MEKGLTSIEVKKLNKKNIYKYIYYSRKTAKQEIANNLQMGLTTVTQNIKLLEQEGLIQRNDFYQSTGGRKAYAIEIVKDVKTSIGIEVLKNQLYIVCIDLYGHIIARKMLDLAFEDSVAYCQKIGQLLEQFITQHHIISHNILGVTIILQAIISKDGKNIIYDKLLNHDSLTLDDFQKYIPYPCRFEHDSKAAAYFECWHKDDLKDAIVLLLNENLGSAIVIDGQVHKGRNVQSGTIEHMIIHPDGPKCYCGQHGCLETYCSMNALSQKVNIKDFFKLLRLNDPKSIEIWHEYLGHLAFAIHNFHTVLDVPIIISGYLASYMNQNDLNIITRFIQEQSGFIFDDSYLSISKHGTLAPAIGGALYDIDQFIQNI